MCGRFATSSEDDIVDAFDIHVVTTHIDPSWDVRPTQQIGVIVEDVAAARRDDRDVVRELRSARWGLVPSWSKALDKKVLLINARSETVLSKPSFRVAARQRRAIIPASGYYEWARNPDGTKTPFFLCDPDQPCLGFAGLYEWWKVPDGLQVTGADEGWLCSATIITKPATDSLGHIHDRMPVVVPHAMADAWLDPDLTDPDQVDALLHSIPDPALVPTERTPG
ncbi:MAG: SOS response-associated peptidase [Propionibacteriaceae bacterium]|nr:SOS response-associated peptidase [Propionibacteriaceae bacterium]